MDGYGFYDEVKTRTKANNIITLFLPFVTSGETLTRGTVTIEERCSFPLKLTMLSSSGLVSPSYTH